MTTRERGPQGDRARRDELEALQVELQETRLALARTEGVELPEVASLRKAFDELRERRDDVVTRIAALKGERERLRLEVRQLRDVLRARKKYDADQGRDADRELLARTARQVPRLPEILSFLYFPELRGVRGFLLLGVFLLLASVANAMSCG